MGRRRHNRMAIAYGATKREEAKLAKSAAPDKPGQGNHNPAKPVQQRENRAPAVVSNENKVSPSSVDKKGSDPGQKSARAIDELPNTRSPEARGSPDAARKSGNSMTTPLMSSSESPKPSQAKKPQKNQDVSRGSSTAGPPTWPPNADTLTTSSQNGSRKRSTAEVAVKASTTDEPKTASLSASQKRRRKRKKKLPSNSLVSAPTTRKGAPAIGSEIGGGNYSSAKANKDTMSVASSSPDSKSISQKGHRKKKKKGVAPNGPTIGSGGINATSSPNQAGDDSPSTTETGIPASNGDPRVHESPSKKRKIRRQKLLSESSAAKNGVGTADSDGTSTVNVLPTEPKRPSSASQETALEDADPVVSSRHGINQELDHGAKSCGREDHRSLREKIPEQIAYDKTAKDRNEDHRTYVHAPEDFEVGIVNYVIVENESSVKLMATGFDTGPIFPRPVRRRPLLPWLVPAPVGERCIRPAAYKPKTF